MKKKSYLDQVFQELEPKCLKIQGVIRKLTPENMRYHETVVVMSNFILQEFIEV